MGLLIAGPPYSDGFVLFATVMLLKEWVQLCFKSALNSRARTVWLCGGSVYIMAACSFFNALSHYNALVLQLLLILAAAATDTCAYFTGRWLGGPKLAPTISPGKTWSGAIGGIIGAQLVLNGFFWLFSPLIYPHCSYQFSTVSLLFIGFSLFLSIVAQCGDLLESWAKRRLGVKDSGALIPGHGGLLDRLDSLLAISLIVGLVVVGMRG
jgi:phosphatidate cytidylyltransferase